MPREEKEILILPEELAGVLHPKFLEELCDNENIKYNDQTSDIELARRLVKDGFLLSDLKLGDLKKLITEYYGSELQGCRSVADCVERVLELRPNKKGRKSQKRNADDSDDEDVVCDPKTRKCYRVNKSKVGTAGKNNKKFDNDQAGTSSRKTSTPKKSKRNDSDEEDSRSKKKSLTGNKKKVLDKLKQLLSEL